MYKTSDVLDEVNILIKDFLAWRACTGPAQYQHACALQRLAPARSWHRGSSRPCPPALHPRDVEAERSQAARDDTALVFLTNPRWKYAPSNAKLANRKQDERREMKVKA